MSYRGFRKPRTTQESRRNERDSEFVRAKRRPGNLPNEWDDVDRARKGRSDRYKNKR